MLQKLFQLEALIESSAKHSATMYCGKNRECRINADVIEQEAGWFNWEDAKDADIHFGI